MEREELGAARPWGYLAPWCAPSASSERRSITDVERERLTFAREHVEVCTAALALPASDAANATGPALEAALAAAMDSAALVLSYLAA